MMSDAQPRTHSITLPYLGLQLVVFHCFKAGTMRSFNQDLCNLEALG